jgi:hypothetical protein
VCYQLHHAAFMRSEDFFFHLRILACITVSVPFAKISLMNQGLTSGTRTINFRFEVARPIVTQLCPSFLAL